MILLFLFSDHWLLVYVIPVCALPDSSPHVLCGPQVRYCQLHVYIIMSEYLDTLNLDSVDNATLLTLVNSAKAFINRTEAFLSKNDAAPSLPTGAVYHDQFLENALLKDLVRSLSKLKYLPTGVRQPSVCLFGEHSYVYSKATTKLKPNPLKAGTTITRALEVVNRKLDARFNSVLINKYHNKNTALNWHQDDEPEIDKTEAIAALSIGAQRKLLIADSPEDGNRGNFSSVQLTENSLFVMEAGFQANHYHKVDRGEMASERGVRYSLTFRRLLPVNKTQPTQHRQPVFKSNDSETLPQQTRNYDPGATMDTKRRHPECYKSIVIGSSLTKGLDNARLSKPGKCFKVICHPGAKVRTIINKFEDIIRDGTICPECIQDIFLVCGGNDVENIRSNFGLDSLLCSYNELISIISDHFLNAIIKVISLIPRRLRDENHLNRILSVNEHLIYVCAMYDNCVYTDIFSHFLKYKRRYYANYEFCLNEALYEADELHFSAKGNSVLAKVIMGVAYNPY